MKNRLKEIRQEKNLSQADIAKALGVTRQAISLYEKGDRELKLETWQKLADFFNVPVDYLLGISKDRSTLTIDMAKQLCLLSRTMTSTFIHIQLELKHF